MNQIPTIEEASLVGPGPPLSQGELTRLFSTILGEEMALLPAATRLTPFTAWALWFYKWTKGRMSGVFGEAEFHALIRRLKASPLPQLLDGQWKVWEDENSADVEGFDLAFCDGTTVTWPGLPGFFHVPTSQLLVMPDRPPLEKLGMDAIVLFTRCISRVMTQRKKEARDGNTGDTTEAGTNSTDQGGP